MFFLDGNMFFLDGNMFFLDGNSFFLDDNKDNMNNRKNGRNCGMSRSDIQQRQQDYRCQLKYSSVQDLSTLQLPCSFTRQ